MEFEFELAPDRDAASAARGLVRAELAESLDADRLADLCAVVTELVNNSVLHGPRRPIRLRFSLDAEGRVRGEIEDQGQGDVAIREMGAPGGGGLGLRIVDALTTRWAVYEGSTHVWFELDPRA